MSNHPTAAPQPFSGPDRVPSSLARWVEGRFAESLGFCDGLARMYGVTIVDPSLLDDPCAPAVRLSYLGNEESWDVARLAVELQAFDAVALCSSRWVGVPCAPLRPGGFAVRRRARLVVVAGDVGCATALRLECQPGHVLSVPTGDLEVLAVAALWQHVRTWRRP